MKEEVELFMILFSIIHFHNQQSKVFGHPVCRIFLGWENYCSTLGLVLKSVNGGPYPHILMRLLTVFRFKQFQTSDFILLTALIVLSHCALKIVRMNKILTRCEIS